MYAIRPSSSSVSAQRSTTLSGISSATLPDHCVCHLAVAHKSLGVAAETYIDSLRPFVSRTNKFNTVSPPIFIYKIVQIYNQRKYGGKSFCGHILGYCNQWEVSFSRSHQIILQILFLDENQVKIDSEKLMILNTLVLQSIYIFIPGRTAEQEGIKYEKEDIRERHPHSDRPHNGSNHGRYSVDF